MGLGTRRVTTQGQTMDKRVENIVRQKERSERGKRRIEREVESSS